MRGWYACIAIIIAITGAPAFAQEARPPDEQTPPAPKGVVTKPPKLLQAVAPEYPKEALAAGKTADVKVRIHIDDGGTVSQVEVLEKVGDGFDEAAIAAAQQYVFE